MTTLNFLVSHCTSYCVPLAVKNLALLTFVMYIGEETGIDFLDTEDGQQYIPAFKYIRLIHVVTDPGSIAVLNTDRIIPRGGRIDGLMASVDLCCCIW